MIVSEKKFTITTNAGVGLGTFEYSQGEFNQIVVTPTTGSTQYDVKITNSQDVDIYDENDVTGTLNEGPLQLATRGNATVTIENASADEDFTVFLSYVERYT